MSRTLLFFFLPLLVSGPVCADDYLDALQAAQVKIDRVREGGARARSALTAGPRASSTHLYRVGQRWKVAAWSADPAEMRHTGEPEHVHGRGGRGAIFLYEVTRVVGGEKPIAEVKITQLDERAFPAIDVRVEAIHLTITPLHEQERKEYRLRSGSKRSFLASAEGMRAPVSYLELFPLEAPELASALRGRVSAAPEIPEALRKIWSERGRKIELARAERFEQDDFFGRRIEAIWQEGDPWPAVLKTPHGTAILLED